MKVEGGFTKKGISLEPQFKKPVVTVVTATFNAAEYLEGSILSILNQSYDNVEFVIIDGQSSDDTLSIIKKYDSKIAYWLSEADNGVYDAWNKAIKASTGEWICFVGADDVLLPTAIEDYIKHINQVQSNELQFVSSKVQLVNNDLSFVKDYGTGWVWDKFKVWVTIAHVGSFHHRSIYEQYGLYDTSYKIAADYELLLRAKGNLSSSFLNKITAQMRIGGLSHSNLKVFKETYHAKVKTAHRNFLICKIEYFIAIAKFYFRKVKVSIISR